eukprot:5937428-Pyramimonas_sp.AAC.1
MASCMCLCIHCCCPSRLSALWAASVVGLMLPYWSMVAGCHIDAACDAAARGDAKGDVACKAW